jgi:xyloglucan-specific endo-beta-1,4-glucanase
LPIGSPADTVTVAGGTWTLYSGTRNSMKVYSFVAMDTTNSFDGDAKDFFNYLTDNKGFPAGDQNLIGTSLSAACLPGFVEVLTFLP